MFNCLLCWSCTLRIVSYHYVCSASEEPHGGTIATKSKGNDWIMVLNCADAHLLLNTNLPIASCVFSICVIALPDTVMLSTVRCNTPLWPCPLCLASLWHVNLADTASRQSLLSY